MVVIRRGTADDAAALTDLAHRAKAHWGYPASWMRQWDPQLTIIPGLSRIGMKRAQLESVRVSNKHRGAKVGEQLVLEAIARARAAGCRLVQLTSDATRIDAQRFYQRLGFVATHVGMKLSLSQE
jgi:GNAT superfamily N-acetyltransferase